MYVPCVHDFPWESIHSILLSISFTNQQNGMVDKMFSTKQMGELFGPLTHCIYHIIASILV